MTNADTNPVAPLLRTLAARQGEPVRAAAPDAGPLFEPRIGELVLAFLVWEAGEAAALTALARLHGVIVDYNELRVCLPDEIVGAIGDKYPLAGERAARLRASLNDIYRREHAMSLSSPWSLSKRDAWTYLSTLEGIPPFVAARTFLLGLGGHAFPVDSRILGVLEAHGVVEAGASADAAASLLERSVRAGEGERAYLLLEAAAGEGAPARPRRAKPARRAPRSKPKNRSGKSE